MQKKWDEAFRAGRDFNPLNEIILDSILSVINKPVQKALDLGCGTGDAVVKLAKRGVSIVGTDWSMEAIEKAKQRVLDAGVSENVHLLQVNLNQLPNESLVTQKYDLILSKLVIVSIDDKKHFCKEVKSMLSENGVFVLMTPVTHESVTYELEDKITTTAVPYEELVATLKDVFTDVTEFNHSYFFERGDLVTFLLK